MTQQKGLKLTVGFEKDIMANSDIGHFAQIKATIFCVESKVLFNRLALLECALGEGAKYGHYTSPYIEGRFDTKAEAEHWAEVSCEKIKAEYSIQLARVNALKVPEDYEVFSDE